MFMSATSAFHGQVTLLASKRVSPSRFASCTSSAPAARIFPSHTARVSLTEHLFFLPIVKLRARLDFVTPRIRLFCFVFFKKTHALARSFLTVILFLIHVRTQSYGASGRRPIPHRQQLCSHRSASTGVATSCTNEISRGGVTGYADVHASIDGSFGTCPSLASTKSRASIMCSPDTWRRVQ